LNSTLIFVIDQKKLLEGSSYEIGTVSNG